MRIRVQHKDGKIETLTLDNKVWSVVEGEDLNSLRDSNGFEHFFNSEGYYDGWGAPVPSTDPSTADAMARAIEEKRKIEE